jgi:hypothetical protein
LEKSIDLCFKEKALSCFLQQSEAQQPDSPVWKVGYESLDTQEAKKHKKQEKEEDNNAQEEE